MTPNRTLAGPSTGISFPCGSFLDLVNDEVVIANNDSTVVVHDRTASGDTPPLRTLSGGATGLSSPEGIALDRGAGQIIVANFSANSLTVYDRGASGNTPPLRTLSGPSTGLLVPTSVVLAEVIPVPTLSVWAQVALPLALAGLAVRFVRRARPGALRSG